MVDTLGIACHYTIALNENVVSLNETGLPEERANHDGETSCILFAGS
jgi:hypothetical protein